MASYVPITREEEQSMLEACGLQQMDDLYRDVPESVRLRTPLNIPSGMAEKDVRREMERLAGENTVFPHVFRGAGAYRHMIPAIVDTVTGHESFRTAYTPYQAEISQGVLQSIFEFQTDICELTGMEAANASVYDGACAAAEACEMCREKKRSRILVSESVDPKVLSVIRTYAFGRDTQVDLVPIRGGVTDPEALADLLQPDVSCLVAQQPNYFGCIEKLDTLTETVHAAGARMIVHCNPIALALLKTPGECGADIAVGEGQPLCRRDNGRGRQPGVCPDPAGQGAAHPPGKGVFQHLFQRSALRRARRRLPGRDGPGRTAAGSRAMRCQGALPAAGTGKGRPCACFPGAGVFP